MVFCVHARKINPDVVSHETHWVNVKRAERPSWRYGTAVQIEPGKMTRAMESGARTTALREISPLVRAGAFGGKETVFIADDDEMLPLDVYPDHLPVFERFKAAGMDPAWRHDGADCSQPPR